MMENCEFGPFANRINFENKRKNFIVLPQLKQTLIFFLKPVEGYYGDKAGGLVWVGGYASKSRILCIFVLYDARRGLPNVI